jgi:hypothetical protein
MKLERNTLCPCGSGKKYKRCCGSLAPSDVTSEDVFLTAGVCNFECAVDCASWCCSGATMITIDEIGKLYDVFPITVGFRKYIPVDAEHEIFLEALGIGTGRHFIVGDFIAGNWRSRRCAVLGKDNLCGLHKEGRKPIQCSLVPFCAIYPEERQDAVFMEQKKGAFSRCRGFRSSDETSCEVWRNGKFIDRHYGTAFAEFRSGLLRQKPFMMKILCELKRQAVFSDFLRGGGILEAAIPGYLLYDLLEAAGIPADHRRDFVAKQKELFIREVQCSEKPIAVFEDCLIIAGRIQDESK